MNNALIINPPIRLDQDACYLPIGLGYIADALQKTGRQINILDFNLTRPSLAEAENQIIEYMAPYVLLTGMSIQWGFVKEYSNIVKKINPECKVIVGGRVTAVPELVTSIDSVDYVVMYDGEDIIGKLLKCLDDNEDPIEANVQGIATEITGKIRKTIPQAFEKDLEKYGPFNYDLWDTEQYIDNQMRHGSHRGARTRRSINMISTRGCPFRCNFCGEDRDSLRRRELDSLFNEIEYLVDDYGIEHVHFSDGLFVNNRNKTIEFCDQYDKRGMDFTWSGNARADIMSEKLLLRMKESSCSHVAYGFETADPEMMKAMNKTTTIEQNSRTLHLHKKYDVGLSSSLIWGAPGETYGSMWRTAKWTIKNNFKPSGINFMMVYPGTPDWFTAVNKGFIQDQQKYIQDTADAVKVDNDQFIPSVNMTKMPMLIYYAWGKILQLVMRLSYKVPYWYNSAKNYYKDNGLLKFSYRVLQFKLPKA